MYFPRHLKSPPLLQCSHPIPVRRHRGDLCAKTCWGWHKGNSFSPQSPPHILDIAPWDTSTAFWIPEPSSCPSPDSAGGSGVRKGWSCPSFSLGSVSLLLQQWQLTQLWGYQSLLWDWRGSMADLLNSVYSHPIEQGRRETQSTKHWLGRRSKAHLQNNLSMFVWALSSSHRLSLCPCSSIGLVQNTLNIREMHPSFPTAMHHFSCLPSRVLPLQLDPPASTQRLVAHWWDSLPRGWCLSSGIVLSQGRETYGKSSFRGTEYARNRQEQAGLFVPGALSALRWELVTALFMKSGFKPIAKSSSWHYRETKKHQPTPANWPNINMQWTKIKNKEDQYWQAFIN